MPVHIIVNNELYDKIFGAESSDTTRDNKTKKSKFVHRQDTVVRKKMVPRLYAVCEHVDRIFGCVCTDTLQDPKKRNIIYVMQYDNNYFPVLVAYRSGKVKWKTEMKDVFEDICVQSGCMDIFYTNKKYWIRIFNTSLKTSKVRYHADLDPSTGKLIAEEK